MSSNENPITRPEHHMHGSSDPLPGARGAQPAVDYSTTTMEWTPSSAFDPENIDNPNTQSNIARSGSAAGQTASNSERPMDVRPAPEGIFDALITLIDLVID
jgi:hypothetical protein